MQDGPNLTWSQAEKVYQVYKALFSNDQSLERIAERGGFSWEEVGFFWKKFREKKRRNPHEFFNWGSK